MVREPFYARFPLSIRKQKDQEREPTHQGGKSKIGQPHNLLPQWFPEQCTRRTSVPARSRTRIARILDYLPLIMVLLRKSADWRPSGFVEPCQPSKATRPPFRP
jgi:hypothetical protein